MNEISMPCSAATSASSFATRSVSFFVIEQLLAECVKHGTPVPGAHRFDGGAK